jgi:hypothetical protein
MRYRNLGIVSIVFRVLGWVTIVLGLVMTGMVASAIQGTTATILIALAGLLGVALLATLLFTLAYVVPLLRNVEENTTAVAARDCPREGCQDGT